MMLTLTRRNLLRSLAALPALGLAAPLARWLGGTPVVTSMRRATFWGSQASRIGFEPPVGRHFEGLVFDDVEEERTLDTSCPDWLLHPENYGHAVIHGCPNPTVRVSVQGGPVLWEDKSQELLPWHSDSLADRLLEKRRS